MAFGYCLISKEKTYKLANLAKAYEKAKIVGRVGRVISVIGVVFTAVEVANAAQKSYDKSSYKPLAAETIRQVGGWGGAIAGAKIGGVAGAWFGAPAGPWLIVTGAGGAVIFGAMGYFGADLIADWVEEDMAELRKDVRSTDEMKTKGIKLVVGLKETQYDFCRRALMHAAMLALLFSQKEAYANTFYPDNKSDEEKLKVKLNWVVGDPNPGDGRNMQSTEWERLRGTETTYYLNDNETKELIRRILNR